MRVEGERVNLVSAWRRILATIDADELERLGEELAGDDDVMPVVLGDGRVVAMKAASVLPMLRALLMLAAKDPASGAAVGKPGFARFDLKLLGGLEAAMPDMPRAGRSRCGASPTN